MSQVKEFVHQNSRIITCEVDNMLGISYGSLQSTMEDNVNMCYIATKWFL